MAVLVSPRRESRTACNRSCSRASFERVRASCLSIRAIYHRCSYRDIFICRGNNNRDARGHGAHGGDGLRLGARHGAGHRLRGWPGHGRCESEPGAGREDPEDPGRPICRDGHGPERDGHEADRAPGAASASRPWTKPRSRRSRRRSTRSRPRCRRRPWPPGWRWPRSSPRSSGRRCRPLGPAWGLGSALAGASVPRWDGPWDGPADGLRPRLVATPPAGGEGNLPSGDGR